MDTADGLDVAVIGLGAMGSSAAYHLARRGKVVAWASTSLGPPMTGGRAMASHA